MKRTVTIIILLLAIAFRGFAQDTITGVVSRIDAPYFEQNVCDSRFALIGEGETYYVMVDNYWPNPHLEELVIHYDTIPVGEEIAVVGNILEMEDENGNVFTTIDISKNLNSNYQQIFGFFCYGDVSYLDAEPISAASFFHYSGLDGFFITINGELITEKPLVVNGRMFVENKRYLFIGVRDNWTDFYGNSFNVFELVDALPYDIADVSISGTITTENDLCLSWPRDEEPYLSVFNDEGQRYLTNKGTLQNSYTNYYIRNTFGNGTLVEAGGFEAVHYDLYGFPFVALEVINMVTEEEITLTGIMTDTGMPYIGMGPPMPGVEISFYSNGHHYLDNPLVWDPQNMIYLYNAFIVGNDTVFFSDYEEMTASFIPRMIMNNYRNPIFYILITEINEYATVQEVDFEIQVFPNPIDDVFYIACNGKTIKHVDIMDSKGCFLLSKPFNGNIIQFSNFGIRGVLFLRIELSDGNVVIKKVVVK